MVSLPYQGLYWHNIRDFQMLVWEFALKLGFPPTDLKLITSIIVVVALALSNNKVCGFISTLVIHKKKKWLYMIVLSLISFLGSIYLVLHNKTMLWEIFLLYTTSTIILGVIVYYLSEYINNSNLLLIRLKDESSKDFLTGLNNVRKFDSLLNDLAQKAIERKEKLSLLFIDIDYFKKINDTYGHSAGDAVLSEIGVIFNRTCKSFYIISRNGGEEFSVLLLDCPSVQAVEVGERIRRAIESHEFTLPTGKKINISVSIGVATYPDTTVNIEKLMEDADTALYEAKHSGRNKVLLFSCRNS